VLPAGVSLVEANSRNALAGVVGMAVGGAVAAAVAGFGAQWSLRLAFAIYVVGTVLAVRLPARVDSDIGEQDIADTVVLTPAGRTPQRRHPLARLRGRVAALPTTVLAAMCSAAGTRLLAGFLTLFVAFLMREHPLPGLSGTLTLALVAGAAGVGNGLGTLVGNALGHRRPEVITAASLLACVLAALLTAAFYSVWTLVALGLVAGLAGQTVKLGADAVVQRDVGESVRTRVFAWQETTLQTAWVIGGGIGIALPLVPVLGFGVVSALLVVVLLVTVWVRASHIGTAPAPAA
jgi:hypothetical protein